MEGIELLESLKTKADDLHKKFAEMQTNLKTKLYNFFEAIKDGGLAIVRRQIDIDSAWRMEDYGRTFEVHVRIEFETKDPERIAKGWQTDFGSDISLSIYDDGLEMNYGTCGTYSHKDEGQITRVYFVTKLWDHEQDIVDLVKENIDMDLYKEMLDVDGEIYRINQDIKEAQRLRERQEVLNQIKRARYICKRRKDSEGHWDENDKWVKDKDLYIYYNHEEIKKVTDSNVLTVDLYWHDSHRRNLEQVISDVKNGYVFLQNEKIDKEDIPSSEGSE